MSYTPLNKYPACLAQALKQYGEVPTYNVEWDQAVLQLLKQRELNEAKEVLSLGPLIQKAEVERARQAQTFPDLTDENVYKAHVKLVIYIANEIILAPQRRKFIVDEHNKDVLKFLLYYFNECPLAESVYPDRGYKVHKNICLQGGVGVGKTMLMQIFSEYLKRTKNPRYFVNVSVTEMVNYYSIHNHIDSFLYNIRDTRTFQGSPVNLCLNDIGVENRPFYGIDTLTVTNDFLHARNEIWSNCGEYERKFAHLTTNLTIAQLKEKFSQKDSYGRIIDRFKTYNIIPITGESRR